MPAPPQDSAAVGDPATPHVVAIDGPVASGKTAAGRELARRLGWQMLDTGIMYRAITWLALERGLALDDTIGLTELARATRMEVVPLGPAQPDVGIRVDDRDATPHLREHGVESAVSTVAAVPGVREQMVARQQEMARDGRFIMVGRDIGTVVLPEAPAKLYLTASPEVRAQRRALEIRESGRDASDGDVLEEIRRRDQLDEGRATSPLKPADDAVHVDTSELNLTETVERMLAIVRERLAPEPAR